MQISCIFLNGKPGTIFPLKLCQGKGLGDFLASPYSWLASKAMVKDAIENLHKIEGKLAPGA